MSLLQEIALTPDVLREDGYGSPASCTLTLSFLRRVFLEEVVVRDLRAGAWSQLVLEGPGNWHRCGRELVRKLRNHCRLVPAEPGVADFPPADDVGWAQEAIQSHQQVNLAALLVGTSIHAQFADQPFVCNVEKVHTSQWWQSRSCSHRLRRQTADYIETLKLVLRHANSLMFIDPHLDPSRPNYEEFGQLVSKAKHQALEPRIEVHRVCYDGAGRHRTFPTETEMKTHFAPLDQQMTACGLGATVMVWDDFHDRYLISNLIGIGIANGFDISGNTEEVTTWTRLSTKDRDDVQKEFDPPARRHELRFQFEIGA